MSNIPQTLRYTPEHEWVLVTDGTTARVGITDHAQDALGDIVFLTLPTVGATVSAGQTCGEVESTKSVSDIYAPLGGVVTARNESVETAPETLNADPYGAGWLFDIELADATQVAELLDASAYEALLSGH
jgi:glycine cleavage system H protein